MWLRYGYIWQKETDVINPSKISGYPHAMYTLILTEWNYISVKYARSGSTARADLLF